METIKKVRFTLLIIIWTMFTTIALAQEKSLDQVIKKENNIVSSEWFSQNWTFLLAGILVVAALIAMARSKKE